MTVELPRKRVLAALAVLGVLVFSKYFYLASLNSYFTFYLIDKFGLSTREAQLYLFLFLAAVAVGTVVGGPVGDRIGRKIVIWVSILGVAPFTLMLPHANLFWTAVLVVIIGAVLASAFGHRGLCAGAGAGQGRHDRGAVLRPVVRHGRAGRGRAGPAGRRHQHRLCLPGLRLSAAAGRGGDPAAENGGKRA